jgi:2-C-methyl-D-erythritol 4-phosphate cytidylyltransferase
MGTVWARMSDMEVWALILAAGRATRFGGPKQWSLLDGRRLVDHAVANATAACDATVVVVASGVEWNGAAVARVVTGGETRAASVRAGLAAVPESADVVVVHDAAHPLASVALFDAVIAAVRSGADGAVPAVPASETVTGIRGDALVPIAAGDPLVLTQMPHAFAASVLRAAHRDQPDARDDASLLLQLGARVVAVPGDPTNLHITTQEELSLALRMLPRGVTDPDATNRH